ncbi:MAG: hypothetical protein INQ03_07820 [Candidatus Heimdallarchaeota archaeon]|nr:hypothetical protein [Candidatus Heimdallarchaeota archaeon]
MQFQLIIMHLWLILAASFDILLVLFHLSFWKIFHWEEQLKTLNFINRQTMKVMNIALILLFAFMATLILAFADSFDTPMGWFILSSFSIFWLIRAIIQPIYYKTSRASLLMMLGFTIGAVLHALPVIMFSILSTIPSID